jgi:hypothetical protein
LIGELYSGILEAQTFRKHVCTGVDRYAYCHLFRVGELGSADRNFRFFSHDCGLFSNPIVSRRDLSVWR